MPKRIYSEKEVAQLIRRAVELESDRTGSDSSGSNKGLTIEDLEKIAADSGIDPELMSQAAEELENSSIAEELQETTKVNKSEIVAEHWIKADANTQMLDDLILELNQRFGTSQDDINWWNRLWNDYSGKAVVKKTANSVDWRYKDEMELYTTRVLMQQRGDKLRIRVGKRQGYNLSWNVEGTHMFMGVLFIFLFTTIGSIVGNVTVFSAWLGILAGLALSAIVIPLSVMLSKRRLNWHKQEVTEIAENLVLHTKRILREMPPKNNSKKDPKSKTKKPGIDIIEIHDDEQKSSNSGDLRNMLRE